MCIIIAKPPGVALPTLDILNKCFSSHPHGIGIAFRHRGKGCVNIKKGFDTPKDLMDYLDKHNVSKDCCAIIHFRYATAGEQSKHNCHPFPVTDDKMLMRSLDLTTDIAVAHNGTITEFGSHAKFSDTQLFIKNILSDDYIKDNIHSKTVRKLIEDYISPSKLAILKSNAFFTIGEFILHNGIYYSNSSFKEKVYRPSYVNTCGYRTESSTVEDYYRGHIDCTNYYGHMGPYAVQPATTDHYCDVCHFRTYSTTLTFGAVKRKMCSDCYSDFTRGILKGKLISQCFECRSLFPNTDLMIKKNWDSATKVFGYYICRECNHREQVTT